MFRVMAAGLGMMFLGVAGVPVGAMGVVRRQPYFSPGPVRKVLQYLRKSPDTMLTTARQVCCG
jgi:hypothetical protein